MDPAFRETERPAKYLSYLLRLWWEGEEEAGWRASLHDPHSGERLGFASVEELFGFLRRQISIPFDSQGRPAASEERR
jgi:hypothetical protein